MREFSIPAPPADLAAVKDWRGTVWTREDHNDDMFLHQWPDAETPERRSWWQLIEDGPLKECQPAAQHRPDTFTLDEILKFISPTLNN